MMINPDKMMKAVQWNILMVCTIHSYVDIVWYDIRSMLGTFGGIILNLVFGAYYHMVG